MAEALRVGFAGTPPFAAAALTAILDAGFEVRLVLTRPDAAQGRGMRLAACAVARLARARGLAVLQPSGLKEAAVQRELTGQALDVLVVAAYGMILPPALLEWPRHGCLNIHASLLPRWRGAAPIARAVQAGDAQTGICIMQMDAGLDTGAVVAREATPVAARETAASLHDKLAATGAALIVATLDRLARDRRLDGVPQPADGVTYASKIERSEAAIDWSQPAATIDRTIRAFNPYPVAQTTLDGVAIKIWQADPVAETELPGRVVRADAGGIVVGCGEGAVCVRELQRAGGKRLSAAAFLAGHPLAAGSQLGA